MHELIIALDYYVDVGGHAVDAADGAVTLVEGNYFVCRLNVLMITAPSDYEHKEHCHYA
jgi:hypothetical protein